MTDEEHELLIHLKAEMQKLREEHSELRDAFLKVPMGSPVGTPHLLERLRTMANNFDNLSWAMRILIWLVPTATGIITATIAWFKGWLAW